MAGSMWGNVDGVFGWSFDLQVHPGPPAEHRQGQQDGSQSPSHFETGMVIHWVLSVRHLAAFVLGNEGKHQHQDKNREENCQKRNRPIEVVDTCRHC